MSLPNRGNTAEKQHAQPPDQGAPLWPDNCTETQRGEAPKIEAWARRWEEWYRSEAASLRQMARNRKLSPEDTEDALQKVWLAAWQKRDLFVGEDAARYLHAWLRVAMDHKIVDALRRCRTVSLETLAQEPMTSVETGLAAARRKWLAARLDEMEADKSPNARLLCGRFRDGRTNADLAAENNKTEKAVECCICRQIEKLRQEMEEAGLADPDAS